MAEYLRPDVYVEDIPNAPVIEQVSSSTGGFMGIAQRGKIGVPKFITSWNDYLREFAEGLDSPFMQNSDLAYAVYGFFQNGGQRCYVMRVGDKAAKVATQVTQESVTMVMKAKDEGEWGNNLKVEVTENELETGKFDLTVYLGNDAVEVFSALDNESTSQGFWIDVLNVSSNFLQAVSGTIAKTTEKITFSGGADDISQVNDNTYVESLPNFDIADDMNLLCIPGQTSKTVIDALMSYCLNRQYVFCILDAPRASTMESVKELRKSLSCKNAALYWPYIKVNDPLSKTGKLRECPLAGHIMGVYARTIQERGVWKAPAGTEAVVRGAIEVVTTATNGVCDILNPLNINVVMPKPNYGIVVWGARCLNPDSSMKYVSDMLLDINIKKSVFLGTQGFVFEPNNQKTWTRVTTTLQAFLQNLWLDGALYGETPAEAYYVKCDETTNPKSIRDAGRMVTEIGYAINKPAEFVIFRFAHNVGSAS